MRLFFGCSCQRHLCNLVVHSPIVRNEVPQNVGIQYYGTKLAILMHIKVQVFPWACE